MPAYRLRRAAAVAAVVALGTGLAACSDRENATQGNTPQGPQSKGIRTGTNPAETTRTSTGASTVGSSIDPAAKGTPNKAPVTKP